MQPRRLAGRDLSKLDISDLDWLKANEPSGYGDAIRSFVNDTDILSDRQRIAQAEEVFEDGEASRKPMQGIINSFAGRKLDYVDGRVVDGGFANSAKPRAAARGEFHAELDVHDPVMKHGGVPHRVIEADQWKDDAAMNAYLDPDNADPGSNSKLQRAVRMGIAASQGDRAGVIEANKRYDFTHDEVQMCLDQTLSLIHI